MRYTFVIISTFLVSCSILKPKDTYTNANSYVVKKQEVNEYNLQTDKTFDYLQCSLIESPGVKTTIATQKYKAKKVYMYDWQADLILEPVASFFSLGLVPLIYTLEAPPEKYKLGKLGYFMAFVFPIISTDVRTVDKSYIPQSQVEKENTSTETKDVFSKQGEPVSIVASYTILYHDQVIHEHSGIEFKFDLRNIVIKMLKRNKTQDSFLVIAKSNSHEGIEKTIQINEQETIAIVEKLSQRKTKYDSDLLKINYNVFPGVIQNALNKVKKRAQNEKMLEFDTEMEVK